MAPSNGNDSVLAVPSERDIQSVADLKTAKRAGKQVFASNDDSTTSDIELSREDVLTALTVEQERELLRKVDWRLIPLLCLLYLVKKLDENNVGALKPTRGLKISDVC